MRLQQQHFLVRRRPEVTVPSIASPSNFAPRQPIKLARRLQVQAEPPVHRSPRSRYCAASRAYSRTGIAEADDQLHSCSLSLASTARLASPLAAAKPLLRVPLSSARFAFLSLAANDFRLGSSLSAAAAASPRRSRAPSPRSDLRPAMPARPAEASGP